jgi:hypothetical protein
MDIQLSFQLEWLKLNSFLKSVVFKIILVIATACLVYTVLSTSVLRIESTDWGLVNKLPLVYYAGLFFLGFVWYVGVKSKSYLPAALILTLGYVFVAPAIVRVPVWTSNSYYPFGESLLINSTGHIPGYVTPDTPPTLGNYHYWPLFLYFASALTTVTGVPHYFLLKLFPLFTVFMYGLLALLVFRIKLAPRYAYLGAAWVLASLFIRQQYFGPQSIGYLFFLAILLVVSLLFFGDESNRRPLSALLLFLFVVATLTHALSSFMSLIIFYAAYLVDRLFTKKRTAPLGLLSLGATIIWIGYNSFSAITFFDQAIEHFIEIFSGVRNVSLYSAGSRVVGSTAQRINFATSWAIVGLGAFIALFSIIYLLRKIRAKRSVAAYSIYSAVLLIMLGMFAFVGEYGPQESFTRAFMFGLVPLSFLCVSLLARKPKLIVVLITLLFFLNIPAQYGADSYRLATDTQLAGTKFIAFQTPENISIVGQFTIYIKYYNPMKNYTILERELSTPFTDIPNSTVIAEELSAADYVILSDLQHNYFIFYLGTDPLDQADFQDFNRVYDNGGFSLLTPSASPVK